MSGETRLRGIALLALIGLFVALYLLLYSLGFYGQLLCGPGSCDTVQTSEYALRAMAWEGRFLVIGFTAGIPSIPLNLTLLKGCDIIGVFYGAMTGKQPELSETVTSDLLGWVASGELKPYIADRFSLDDAPRALRLMMDRQAKGKLVIEP